MAKQRLTMHRLQEMVRLRRMGLKAHETAKRLKMSPNSERTYRLLLEAQGLMWGPASELPELETLREAVFRGKPQSVGQQEISSVAEWRDEIQRMVTKQCGAKAIYDKLRLDEEHFTGSLGAVKRLVARLKREAGPEAESIVIPVTTLAGEVAQIDFGYVGCLYDPRREESRKAWVFVMVLGYSRHMFCKVVFDQSIQTWLTLHAQAFRAFGGVPSVLVPDNLKAAVIKRAFGTGDNTQLNRSYLELARHYGCQIDPTPVRAPEKKGKVESAVKYVKNNFFRPRELADINEANRHLKRWVHELAGKRTHGTTGQAPLDLFEAEKEAFLKLPEHAYELTWWVKARVHKDSHIHFDRRLFSVPWQYVGQTVWVKATALQLRIYADELCLCTHYLATPGRRVTVDAHLPEHRVDLRHRNPSYWKVRAQAVGVETGALVDEIFGKAQVLSPLRQVQALVSYLEGFPTHRAEAASKRARYYDNHTYRGIKRILEKGLELEPLPDESPRVALLKRPRFARTPEAYVPVPGGVGNVRQ